jgi:hypothetical protein
MDKLDDVVKDVATTWNSTLPNDKVQRFSKDWELNLWYSRLVYRADLSDGVTSDVFQVVATGDLVEYDIINGTWSFLI